VVELGTGAGSVLASPRLSGRLFCELNGELVHRLDTERMLSPAADEYNNLGGNSLWPAPEGGPFAYNYPPGSEDWYVQAGIADAVASVTDRTDSCVTLEKRIRLTNRKGADLDLCCRRVVRARALELVSGTALEGFCYESEDTFVPLAEYSTDTALLAAWSLEQFPGADGILVFAKVECPATAINFDFYGDPRDHIQYREDHFTWALGGPDRHQIGIRVSHRPSLIGAYDRERSLLILRTTAPCAGAYFNIADNDQPEGPWSAADLYSIFNGGPLGFFELETVGAMQQHPDGTLAPCSLVSRTEVLRGGTEALRTYVEERFGIRPF
jgi:hypothetical protein